MIFYFLNLLFLIFLLEKIFLLRRYNIKQLAENTVPVAAAVYENDMYVGKDFSLETASLIKGAKTWITSEYEHNGLRANGEKIFLALYEMLYPKEETPTQNANTEVTK